MLNVITLFSGYDSQALALNRLGIPYDLVAWAEIDKHACTAHDALFPQFKGRNVGDVSNVDWAEWHKQHPQPIDLLTYSSPCQDFSSAGLQRGGEEGSGTRSGLLWETERAVRELRPRHLVFENVGGLVSDKFIDLFNRWQARLNKYGYTNFQQLMNAKDYGVPQNRLRIFMVSVLDCQRAYYFPKPFRLERRLKDELEQNVDERYYLSDERVAKLMQETAIHRDRGNGFAFRPHTPEEIASTVKCSGIGDKTDNFVIQRIGRYNNGQSGLVYGIEGVSPTIDSSAPEHGRGVQIAEPAIIDDVFYDREPRVYDTVSPTIRSSHDIFKVAEPQINVLGQLSSSQNSRIIDTEGISPAVINGEKDGIPKIAEPQINVLGNLYDNNGQAGRIYDANGISPTLDNMASGGNKSPKIVEPCISSIRGRADGDWHSSEHQQRLEIGGSDTSNSLTSVAKDNLLIEPQFHDADDIPFDDGKGGIIWARYESEEYERLMNELAEKEWEKYVQRGIQLTLGENEPSIISPGHGYFEGAINTETSPTVKCSAMQAQHFVSYGIRIRRLTERELYRLMDVSETDIDTLLAAPIPRTQHAKLAGNSIVVACLYYIFRNLFVDTEPEAGTQTTLF